MYDIQMIMALSLIPFTNTTLAYQHIHRETKATSNYHTPTLCNTIYFSPAVHIPWHISILIGTRITWQRRWA